ncbi:MAG: 50S ribosomal protein L22 [Candidatus Komeilibacteria bacterium RIFOXYC1_FULL_37_11]|uniref:Large ribosomal subunit protein uL22 n=1 Tax=Candidatus Komeilibacteria bacterium RIFOXYC1_FULL_37_11 TaxID=1798555 RepID=A0A1G2BYC8_9BACT|nr:MAG: 50S ribosomal protein L22 [Candidatus Komeilibacteria bacterium RIFOXYC1_FULL_37_11]OGY95350.1 MAG: 50S ribosomal protein L22 [Candidatus Komeilibacteria bacterium RIFOXYD1_FULL_37_29]OGY97215.1 MAG: 50S ribosomal protein L22 [Candidatus Komeilibacteria bacterium RIFOXYD2_FULL_37_8]
MVESKAQLKNLRISYKKVGLVAGAIRGLDVSVALAKLQIVFKKSSPEIEKLLKSAVANAIDRYSVKEEDLKIKSIIVNKAMDLKRWKPAAFGRAHPFRKASCHVAIILQTKEGVKVVAKEKVKKVIDTVDLTKTDKKLGSRVDSKKVNSNISKKTVKESTTGAAKDKSKVKKG